MSHQGDRRAGFEPTLLLHVCCAPCSTHVIDLLQGAFEVTAFFYNPNVSPPEEHLRRAEEAARLCKQLGVGFIAGDYDEQRWSQRMQGRGQDHEGGRHCSVCFRMRLAKTAAAAEKQPEEWETSHYQTQHGHYHYVESQKNPGRGSHQAQRAANDAELKHAEGYVGLRKEPLEIYFGEPFQNGFEDAGRRVQRLREKGCLFLSIHSIIAGKISFYNLLLLPIKLSSTINTSPLEP